MASNRFFTQQGPFPLIEIAKVLGYTRNIIDADKIKIQDIKSLDAAESDDITFLNSSKYKDSSLKTKASACLTTINLEKFLPHNCIKIYVKNILLAVTQVSKMFYPKADLDQPDLNLVEAKNIEDKFSNVKFGTNVLIGKNVKIGKGNGPVNHFFNPQKLIKNENVPYATTKNQNRMGLNFLRLGLFSISD